jgi:uncharacterized membrane protein
METLMSRLTHSVVARALLIGLAAGLRSQVPGAVLAWHRDEAPLRARWRRWPVLRSAWGRRLLVANGTGEALVDKLPGLPPRTDPRPLFGRLLFGGLAGAAIGSERPGKGSIARGAVAGMAGAAIGTVGATRSRAAVAELTGLPDPAVAVVEDVAAISMANRAVTNR